MTTGTSREEAINAAADAAHDAVHEAIQEICECTRVKEIVVDAILSLKYQPAAPEQPAALEHHAVCDRKYPTLCQACIAEYEVGKQTAAQPSSQPTDAKQPQVGTIGHVSDGAGTLIGSLSGPIASALSSSQPPAGGTVTDDLPKQPVRRQIDRSEENTKFGHCDACGDRRNLVGVGGEFICGCCLDAEHLSDWKDYAAKLLALLQSSALSPLSSETAGKVTDAPNADWLWSELMDWCKKRGCAPANYDDLFAIVKKAREQNLLQSAERGKDAEDALWTLRQIAQIDPNTTSAATPVFAAKHTLERIAIRRAAMAKGNEG